MHKSPRVSALKAELEARKAELLAELGPAREAYERLSNDPELLAARRTIKKLNPQLFEIENELAAIARAGGAKSLKADAGVYNPPLDKGSQPMAADKLSIERE